MADETEGKSEEEAETPAYKPMSARQFWIRLAIWLAFAVVAPIVFLGCRFGLFTQREGAQVSITGYGILAILIVTVAAIYIMKSARKGLNDGNMLAQCIDGFCALLPIVVLILVIDASKNSISAFEDFLIFFVLSEAIAVPVNPMRRWAEEHHIERGKFIAMDIVKAAIKEYKKK